MNFNSIITKVIFIFVLTQLLFVGIFFSYYLYEKEAHIKSIHQKYHNISKYMRDKRMREDEIMEYLRDLDFTYKNIDPKLLFEHKPLASGGGFDIFMFKQSYYLFFHTPFGRFLFKDNSTYKAEYYGFFILTLFFMLNIFGFLWIIKALLPLKELKTEIKKFSNGELDIDCKSDKKDEIAEVANEFDSAVKKISLLLESRQLFLRTIMHELKTPIAKGRIVSELVEDEKQKNRLNLIFEKLNFLIDDFAKIEQVVSKNYIVHRGFYTLDTILQNSISMLMLDEKEIKRKIELKELPAMKLYVDLELFSMAIKNLLDNAIKYSKDKKVQIELVEQSICFISIGEKLSKPLSEYFKPFYSDTKAKNHGMGLGLYIVHSIVTLFDMKLEYLYKDGRNIFIVK